MAVPALWRSAKRPGLIVPILEVKRESVNATRGSGKGIFDSRGI